jgi:hypothetical protein
VIEWRKVTTGKCRKLADVPAGAQIESVNGRECVGTCEGCLGPILDGQKHGSDPEGVMWHERCPRSANSGIDMTSPNSGKPTSAHTRSAT